MILTRASLDQRREARKPRIRCPSRMSLRAGVAKFCWPSSVKDPLLHPLLGVVFSTRRTDLEQASGGSRSAVGAT